MTETKNALASKTIWVNFLTLVAAVAATFGVVVVDEAEVATLAAGVVAVINIFVRFKTNTGVSLK